MKIHKTVCIDQDNIGLLEGINASSLINELLSKHFLTTTPTITKNNKGVLDEKIKELEKEKSAITATLKQDKIIEDLDMPDLVKSWFIKTPIKPTLISLITFMQAHKLPTLNCSLLLNSYDTIHNA